MVLSLITLVFGLLVSLMGSHFVARTVDNEFKDRKNWVRISLSFIALVISFAVIMAIVVTMMYIISRH